MRCVLAGIKLNQGGYIPFSHVRYEEVLQHATWVHMAHSWGWKIVLSQLIGHIWDLYVALGDDPSGHLKTFWESYWVEPWDVWTVGGNEHVPCLIPSNQMVEAFFKNVVRLLGGRGHLRKASTTVFHEMLPKIMNHQEANLPDQLCFEVCNRTLHFSLAFDKRIIQLLIAFRACILKNTALCFSLVFLVCNFCWQVEYIQVEMLKKARVLAAPPSVIAQPRRYRDFYYDLTIVFQNKFMLICNQHTTGDFKCAYVFRGKQDVYAPPLRTNEIEQYELWNHGDASDWMPANATQRGLERMEEQLQRRIDIMQAQNAACCFLSASHCAFLSTYCVLYQCTTQR